MYNKYIFTFNLGKVSITITIFSNIEIKFIIWILFTHCAPIIAFTIIYIVNRKVYLIQGNDISRPNVTMEGECNIIKYRYIIYKYVDIDSKPIVLYQV